MVDDAANVERGQQLREQRDRLSGARPALGRRGQCARLVDRRRRAAFTDRAACIIRQFESYETAPGLHHPGKLVAGEGIADVGGLVLAWDAWQRARGPNPSEAPIDGFTPEQRFFIAYAQARAANLTPEASAA